MNCEIFLLVFVASLFYYLPPISGKQDSRKEKCLYADTVDLTGREKIQNGSYRYDDILIAPEQQDDIDYRLNFFGKRERVPTHVRGCACKKRPCVRLCCPRDQFLSDITRQCEKITPDMSVSWDIQDFSKTNDVKMINILKKFTTQIGFPCNQLERADPTQDQWKLLENGTLFFESIEGDTILLNTLQYCFSPVLDNSTGDYILLPYSCAYPIKDEWRVILTAWNMVISIIFLIPTILVYLAFKELRDNLRGKLLICYLISLTMGYIILSFINLSGIGFDYIPCSILGFTCYFFFMAAFLWLSVLCYDIWLNFKDISCEFKTNKNKKLFRIYSLYVWLSASIASIASFIIQKSKYIENIYKPGIGKLFCWLNGRQWSAAIYFYGPNLIILIFNIVTFTILTIRIYKVKRDVARVTQRNKFIQENAIVILRLFMIMGVSWIFDILSYCLRDYKQLDLIFLVSDIINAIQGLLIFLLFVLKRNVLDLLKKRYQSLRADKSRISVSSVNTNFSKLQTMSSVQTP